MSLLLTSVASGAASSIPSRQYAQLNTIAGSKIGSRANRNRPTGRASIAPEQALRHVRKPAQDDGVRHPIMVRSRMAALVVSAIVAIPTYDHISVMFDSSTVGLMAVSLLLIPLLSLMRCLLDLCIK